MKSRTSQSATAAGALVTAEAARSAPRRSVATSAASPSRAPPPETPFPVPEPVMGRSAVLAVKGGSVAQLYADMVEDLFPKPIRASKRAVYWLQREVAEWQQQKIRERDSRIAAAAAARAKAQEAEAVEAEAERRKGKSNAA